jgi:hypothetical protein
MSSQVARHPPRNISANLAPESESPGPPSPHRLLARSSVLIAKDDDSYGSLTILRYRGFQAAMKLVESYCAPGCCPQQRLHSVAAKLCLYYATLPLRRPASSFAICVAKTCEGSAIARSDQSSFTPNTVTSPSPLTATRCFACLPHRTATAGTALRSGSDHALLLFRYCCTVIPDGPPVARYCPE